VRRAESEIRRALPRTGDARIAFAPRVLFGRPSGEILRRLEERPVDLVLVGSRGAGGLRRALLGSVAADLLREAPCNVLLVSPPASRAALSA
jgi:nucleotide-binding universal stress UspA family protein